MPLLLSVMVVAGVCVLVGFFVVCVCVCVLKKASLIMVGCV